MKPFAKVVAVAVVACFLFAPLAAMAEEEVPTDKELSQTEGEPPVIPHKVSEKDTAKECLACHKKGRKGAPVTSHPERKSCTQCHIPVGGFSTSKSVKGAKGK